MLSARPSIFGEYSVHGAAIPKKIPKLDILKGVTNKKSGGSNVASFHRYWSRTMVIDVHFNFDWAVAFI